MKPLIVLFFALGLLHTQSCNEQPQPTSKPAVAPRENARRFIAVEGPTTNHWNYLFALDTETGQVCRTWDWIETTGNKAVSASTPLCSDLAGHYGPYPVPVEDGMLLSDPKMNLQWRRENGEWVGLGNTTAFRFMPDPCEADFHAVQPPAGVALVATIADAEKYARFHHVSIEEARNICREHGYTFIDEKPSTLQSQPTQTSSAPAYHPCEAHRYSDLPNDAIAAATNVDVTNYATSHHVSINEARRFCRQNGYTLIDEK